MIRNRQRAIAIGAGLCALALCTWRDYAFSEALGPCPPRAATAVATQGQVEGGGLYLACMTHPPWFELWGFLLLNAVTIGARSIAGRVLSLVVLFGLAWQYYVWSQLLRDLRAAMPPEAHALRWVSPTWQDALIFLLVVGLLFWRLNEARITLVMAAQKRRLTGR